MTDSPKADDARDDFILQERLSGRSARSIGKELRCPVSEIDEALDRTLPKITNEAKRRILALDLDRLDGLIEVFYKRAVEKVDIQAGLLVVKILERKAALLGLDSPQKLDIVQVQAPETVPRHEKIREAIMRLTEQPPVRRAAFERIDQLGAEKALELLGSPQPQRLNGGGDGQSGPPPAGV